MGSMALANSFYILYLLLPILPTSKANSLLCHNLFFVWAAGLLLFHRACFIFLTALGTLLNGHFCWGLNNCHLSTWFLKAITCQVWTLYNHVQIETICKTSSSRKTLAISLKLLTFLHPMRIVHLQAYVW